MQSVLEAEARRLLLQLREWVQQRDRAVLFGALLCAVPFLPVTFIGVLITAANYVLMRLGKLPRAEQPLMIFGAVMAVFYVALWWLLYRYVIGDLLWTAPASIWRFLMQFLPFNQRGIAVHA